MSHRVNRVARSMSQVVAVALVAIALASPARGQGTSGTLPDPITTRELMSYAARLGLSEQQSQAIAAMHEEYKREFRILREGEIAQFLQDMRGAESGMRMPQRREVEDIFKRITVLNRRVEALDNKLFEQMQAALTEEQKARMARVRMARERERFSAQRMLWAGGAPAVDLSELVLEQKLTDADAQAVDGIMASYETTLTSQLNKLQTASSRMYLDMFDAMEQAGMAEVDMEDVEAMAKFGETMQTIWGDLTRKANALAAEITDLNKRTLTSMTGSLPPDTARTLRHQFYMKAYPESAFAFGDEQMYEHALRLRDLTDEQRQAVTAARTAYRSECDQIGQQAVDAIEEQRNGASPFDYNQEVFEKFQKKIGELHARAEQARQTAREAIRAAVGDSLAATLPGFHDAKSAEKKIAVNVSPSEEVAVAVADLDPDDAIELEATGIDAQNSWGGDQFMPAAITDRELSQYSTTLALDDAQRAVLEDLFDQYKQKYATMQAGEIRTLSEALQKLWQYDEDTGQSTPPDAAMIDQVYALRKSALQVALAADASFFDDIAVAALREDQATALDRVRLARQRAVYNRAHYYNGIAWGSSNAAGIDLTAFITPLRLTPEQLSAIEATLREYEKQITVAFVKRYEAALAAQRAQDQWNAETMAAQNESGNPMQMAARFQQIMGASQKQLREAGNAIAAINRRTLDDLTGSLPPTAADALQGAFNRRAYPDVYTDGAAAGAPIRSALRLSDLTADQQRQINDLAAEYHPAYASLCGQMVDISEEAQMPIGADFSATDWKHWQERQEALAKITFDRTELSAKAIRTLRAILTETQVERLGGLPDPKPEDHNPWD